MNMYEQRVLPPLNAQEILHKTYRVCSTGDSEFVSKGFMKYLLSLLLHFDFKDIMFLSFYTIISLFMTLKKRVECSFLFILPYTHSNVFIFVIVVNVRDSRIKFLTNFFLKLNALKYLQNDNI